MYKLNTLFIMLLISIYGFSQNLSISQLLEVKSKNLGEAEEYLTLKGWEFMSAEEPTIAYLGTVTFSYNKDNMSDRAQSFLLYYYSDYSTTTRVSIQVSKKEKYNEYLNSIKSFGCKMISSKVKNGNLIKVYQGKTTTFIITATTSENFFGEATASWIFILIDNLDYDVFELEGE